MMMAVEVSVGEAVEGAAVVGRLDGAWRTHPRLEQLPPSRGYAEMEHASPLWETDWCMLTAAVVVAAAAVAAVDV